MLGHNSLTIVRTIRTRGREISVVEMGRRRLYKEGVTVPLTIKATKFESAYTVSPNVLDPRVQCALCIHYISNSIRGEMGACNKVIGVIDPQGWCKHYDRKLKVVSE